MDRSFRFERSIRFTYVPHTPAHLHSTHTFIFFCSFGASFRPKPQLERHELFTTNLKTRFGLWFGKTYLTALCSTRTNPLTMQHDEGSSRRTLT